MIETLGERLVKQGVEQGIEQERRVLARKLLADGMAASKVAKLTGLSASAVRQIGSKRSRTGK